MRFRRSLAALFKPVRTPVHRPGATSHAPSLAVDDKVAVYLASISLAGGATIVADNDKAAEACHRSDCVCVMSRPRPWSSSTDSVGVRQAFDDDESSGSSYSTSEDVHDCSASKRPMNKAWSPNGNYFSPIFNLTRVSSPPQKKMSDFHLDHRRSTAQTSKYLRTGCRSCVSAVFIHGSTAGPDVSQRRRSRVSLRSRPQRRTRSTHRRRTPCFRCHRAQKPHEGP